ncbi:MAG: hypothetical protein GY787_10210 [Alteromonadales bacterium]|nr:hypothetical protein [Alteromonadales bacterium]
MNQITPPHNIEAELSKYPHIVILNDWAEHNGKIMIRIDSDQMVYQKNKIDVVHKLYHHSVLGGERSYSVSLVDYRKLPEVFDLAKSMIDYAESKKWYDKPDWFNNVGFNPHGDNTRPFLKSKKLSEFTLKYYTSTREVE